MTFNSIRRTIPFILLLIFSGVSLDSNGQNITLESQADVDAFDPETTMIDGSLQIGVESGSADITDLSNLSKLTFIKNNLRISHNQNLENIDELDNIVSIGGQVYIHDNSSLTNLDGLIQIDSLDWLEIARNDNLTSLEGLKNLIIVDDMDISRNNKLTNLEGLNNLKVVDRIYISRNNNLINLNGLYNLTTANVLITISHNPSLINIGALSKLELAGDFRIDSNENLTTIDDLPSFNTITYTLFIASNDNLINIDGLNALTSIGANINHIAVLIERNDKLLNIDGLSNVKHIGGTIWLSDNISLQNLDGFSSLVSAGKSITLYDNINIQNIDGLSNLTTVGEDIRIWDHENLKDLNGLSNLVYIGGDLSISSNSSLTNCCGIQELIENQITSVGGNVYISHNPSECKTEEEILSSNCAMKMRLTTSPPCLGVENGSIQVYLEKFDTIPFYYEWMRQEDGINGNGISDSEDFVIDQLGMGTYDITVTNHEPDTVIRSNIFLSQLDGYIFEVTEVNTTNSSNGQSNGSITLITSGGIPPYTISWSGITSGGESGLNSESYTIPLLSYGEYSITVADDSGASKTVEVSLLDEFVEVVPCQQPLDIVILNDVSGSVDATEYQESKEFFVDFLSHVNINTGSAGSKAAIIEWSAHNQQQVKIPMTGDMVNLSSYLDATRSFDYTTAPHEAMKFGASYLENNSRPDVEKVLILSTDGTADQIPSSLIALADKFKARGYHIVTIAFDHSFSDDSVRDILKKIATIDALAPGASAYSQLNENLAKNIVFNYLCPIDPGSSAITYFERDGLIEIIDVNPIGNCPNLVFAEVVFDVSAQRELSIPAGTPITFYHNNPNLFGSSPILTWQIPCAIPIGTSETHSVTLPMNGPSNIFAVLNDDGIQNPPINFPITEIEELAYSNNISSARICLDDGATLQAFKYATSPIPACDTLVIYTINICNISEVDASGVTVTDLAAEGFDLTGSIFNDNGCATAINNTYNIPADCCLSLSMTYDASNADFANYNDQGVDLDGPSNQIYIDFDGSTTTDEDVLVNGNINCPSTDITFSMTANVDESCDDAFIEFEFTINNEMNIPIQGLKFTDILPNPCTWAHEPYGENGMSITNFDISDNEAIFTIDEVQANTMATFRMDASLNSWGSDGSFQNSATLENVPDVINGGYISLSSNTTNTEITASTVITLPETIIVENQIDTVYLEAVLSTSASVIWTTEGDGYFVDVASESTAYVIGNQDKINGQVSLFISAISTCNETGKNVILQIENPNSTDQNNDLELMRVFPNPVKSMLVIESHAEFQAYEVLDFNGKKVAEKRQIQSRSDLEINMSSHPSGVYLIKLISTESIKYAKVVKI